MKLKSYYLLTILFSLNLLSNERYKRKYWKILPPEAKVSLSKNQFFLEFTKFLWNLQYIVSKDGIIYMEICFRFQKMKS